jgi:hypothetical protein
MASGELESAVVADGVMVIVILFFDGGIFSGSDQLS